MELSESAQIIYKKRYLLKDEEGNIIETPEELLHRVARAVSIVEDEYERKKIEDKFFEVMADSLFLPNTPTLMNAGTSMSQLSACFVLPVEDSMEGIFDALKRMALVQKSGGGTGFSFSRLRPNGDLVRSTMGTSSGPISFLKIFDTASGSVIQGGARMGANMGSLHCTHPDVIEFICCKDKEGEISNFNLSVLATDEFMRKVTGEDSDPLYAAINPRDGRQYVRDRKVVIFNAVDIFNKIVEAAWRKGDPGLIFIDRMNEGNPTPHVGEYETTNPCGEQILLPFEACCLGSINLSKFVLDGTIDFNKLKDVVNIAVRFLDNVIDITKYPLKEITDMHLGNRKIGLGVMGWHDLLVMLGIPYDSDEALRIAEQIMEFINVEAKKASVKLADKRGVFPNFVGSVYDTGKSEDRVRNATRTTIAPTGSISILANTSGGIEPYFSLAFTRKKALDGTDIFEVNPLFVKYAKQEGFYSDALVKEIRKTGNMPENVPHDIRKLFKTAMQIDPLWHIKHQSVFQKHVDNAVSKTVNLSNSASVEDVKSVYIEAWRSGCKGITVYRDGSRQNQFLSQGEIKPIGRPDKLYGCTVKTKTSLGNLFVTINKTNNKPFELFAQIGKAGSDVVAFTEAIARLISLSLRCGVKVDDIVGQLIGIGGARSAGFGPNKVLSVPDAIARVLQDTIETSIISQEHELCPECGVGTLVMSEGCSKCESCGYSQC